MRRGRRGITVLAAMLAGCAAGAEERAGPPPEAARDAARDGAAIVAASRAFSDAYVAGDTAAIGRLYTADALLLPPERDVRGREAITRYFAPGPRRVNVSHAMRSESLRIDGTTAVDVGLWHNTWRVGDEPPDSASGRYLVVWRLEDDGAWRIELDMWHRPR